MQQPNVALTVEVTTGSQVRSKMVVWELSPVQKKDAERVRFYLLRTLVDLQNLNRNLIPMFYIY